MPAVITVAAAKGGVGKTTLSYELATALSAVLVDLDWDAGGATRMWGFDPTQAARAPLLDALERGPDAPAPRVKRRVRQPGLLPSHPDLAASAISADLVADCLESWAGQWDCRAVVVDTHPGANELTDGAVSAADLLVVPVVIGNREFAALDAMLADFAGYRTIIVPMMVPPIPARRQVDRLAALAQGRAEVAPPVSEHRWIRRRLRRSALVAQANPGQRLQRAAGEFRAVARTIEEAISG